MSKHPQVARRSFVAECGTEEFGRLIRTSNDSEPPKSIAYIVALSDPADAIELIRSRVADPGDKVEDIGRVSEELLKTLQLDSGGFMRADGRPDRKKGSRKAGPAWGDCVTVSDLDRVEGAVRIMRPSVRFGS